MDAVKVFEKRRSAAAAAAAVRVAEAREWLEAAERLVILDPICRVARARLNLKCRAQRASAFKAAIEWRTQ